MVSEEVRALLGGQLLQQRKDEMSPSSKQVYKAIFGYHWHQFWQDVGSLDLRGCEMFPKRSASLAIGCREHGSLPLLRFQCG